MQEENRNLSSNQEAKESIATKIYMIICAVAAVIFVLFVIPAVVLIGEGLHENKLINSFSKALREYIWVSEEPLVWFHNGIGQSYEDGEVIDLLWVITDDVYYTAVPLINSYEDNGASLPLKIDLDFTLQSVFGGKMKYDIRKNIITVDYSNIKEFRPYTEEEFAEKYPQFEFMTRDDYEAKNWPERYPEANIDELLSGSIWVCEEHLMWTKDDCGQIELDGKIIDIFCGERPYFEIRTLTDWYNIPVENEIGYFLAGADIYQHRTSGNLIVTNLSENEYPLSQYQEMIFKEIPEEEFAEKYPQFNLFTLEEYEKENKVGDYRE